jgi:hypothetical protein
MSNTHCTLPKGHLWPTLRTVLSHSLGTDSDRDLIQIDFHPTAVIFTGIQEDLIAAGVVSSDMLPCADRRVIFHIGPEIPRDQHYAIRRKPDGLFEVAWYHEPRSLAHKPERRFQVIQGGVA